MKSISRILLLVGLLAAAGQSQASIINYTLTPLGGTNYRYDYTVTNDGSITSTVSLFDISFDPALYDELSLTDLSTAADWAIAIFGSGVGIPAAFDAFATGAGIGVGQSLGGFAVSFSWLGGGSPGAQAFQIYDATTFDLLGEGVTTAASPVPVPGTLGLLSLGLLGLAFTRRAITA